MLERFLPGQADNRFEGRRAALWLLGLYIALKLVMGFNSIFNTASVAVGADGIPLDRYGPAAANDVLLLFALTSLGQLVLALIALTVLIRYRALVPFIYLVLIGESVARRLIALTHDVTRPGDAPAPYIVYGLLALLVLGLVLALLPARRRQIGS